MSLGYAEKLSYRDDVGAVGQKEFLDEDQAVNAKCRELAELVRFMICVVLSTFRTTYSCYKYVLSCERVQV